MQQVGAVRGPARLRAALLTGAGLLLSVVFTSLTFFDLDWRAGRLSLTARMDWAQLRAALHELDTLAAAAFVLLTFATLPVRAWAWGHVLSPAGRFRDRYHATAIGFMAVNLLPARVGEITRALVLPSRVPGLSRAQAVGSVLLTRVFDLVALWLLCLPLPFALELDGDAKTAAIGGFATMTALAAGALLLVWIAGREGGWVGPWLHARLGPRAERHFSRFCAGLGSRPGAARLGAALAGAVAVQILSALSYVPVLGQLAPGVPPLAGAVFGLVVVSMGLAVPSGPSGIGVYHFALAYALRAAGASPAAAAAIAIVTHLGCLSAFVGAGLLSLVTARDRASHVGGRRRRGQGVPLSAFDSNARSPEGA